MKTLATILLLTATLFAQSPKTPRPFVGGALELMPDGYSPVAIEGFVGLNYEHNRFSTLTVFGYDNGHKTDDNTTGNSEGHDRYAKQEINIWLNKSNYLGTGAYWHELSTTNYTKSAWNPVVQYGHDFLGDTAAYTVRVQGQYMFNSPNQVTKPHCVNCKNNEQGFIFNAWYPSLATNKHFFLVGEFGTYIFNNVGQTSKTATSYFSVGAFWRF